MKTQKMKRLFSTIGVTIFGLIVLGIFLMPFIYGLVTSVKTQLQIANVDAPFIPSVQKTYELDGKQYDVVALKTDAGTKHVALIKKTRAKSTLLDIDTPGAQPFEWDGKWQTLEPVWETSIQWKNYNTAWNSIKFLKLLGNTVTYAVLSTIGAVCSAALVSYGFARFKFPYRNALFIIVMSTIILPPAVTLIPRYAFFYKIGWVGSWLPIIIPQYFSNGWNIFLLRQFFMGVPREMDEAAKIDGAGYFRTFFSVILPQAVPALVAVTLFHFFYCWNDFLEPLIYLAGTANSFPITIGLTQFNRLFTRQTELVQAATVMSLAIPVVIFFFAQRFFMQGVVVTGVEK
ncbi:binding-protein-dependent transport systems inner membrane component [Candidatus Moduliflexus flocculans]|uniref:Binding-protein-dependent transport systems inner membrane component n=1 Tax=Candidatus Moduliflexus flocculans TaxID=1499966 RepID=A0A0S6VRG0_9BACT|nr:binding-protein-dependent transport systems inner membrane component [Candidatus Moduliflexus flocculans]